MWDKEFEKCRFNGIEIETVGVVLDGEQRVQVSEIAQSDDAFVAAMGSSAKNFTLECIFFGKYAISDLNELVDAVTKEPTGVLEHPLFGEIECVFKSHSFSVTTKRGLVTASLSFIRTNSKSNAKSRELRQSERFNSSLAIERAEVLSANRFSDDVFSMTLDEINVLKSKFEMALGELISISSRIDVAVSTMQRVTSAIQTAFNAVSSLSTRPSDACLSISDAFHQCAVAVKEDKSSSSIIDTSRDAQKNLISLVDPTAPEHFNNQLVIGAVSMNKDLSDLEQSTAFDPVLSERNPDLVLEDFDDLTHALGGLIEDVTSSSRVENLEMYDALVALVCVIDAQKEKVKNGIKPKKIHAVARFTPALALAHRTFTSAKTLQKLNSGMHPLFCRGQVNLGGSA